ncbi:hypothetical protein [Streptomyces sp. NPDC057302]|uniref:hypothetical protein n=1 Tax=Streptomyces sp. NPDC057302 TaxID=3346094 RepID=UPI0036306905
MGVFARFRRKSKDTEEASTTEAAVGTLTAEKPEAAGDSPAAESGTTEKADETGKEDAKVEAAAVEEKAEAAAEGEAEAVTKAEGKAEAETDAKAEDEAEDSAESTEEAAAENVDIPKQQSAEKAADNDEADEGARK